jgi:hypothetical protein
LWAATSRRAQLFRIDTRNLTFELIESFGDDKFVFALGQSNSGKVYVGTFPDAKIRQITYRPGRSAVKDLNISVDQIGGRTNVKDIVANETGQVFFHLGSPGRLIGYDEATGRSSPIIDTTDSFLFPLRDFPPAVEAISSAEDLKPREKVARADTDNRPLPPWALTFAPRLQFQQEEVGYEMTVTHDGRITKIPLRARQGGMPIVAFQRVGPNLAIGSTYWNRWFFDFDLVSGTGVAKDTIGRTGEFFTACGDGEHVFIPHYLGLLLEYNPSRPLNAATVIPPGGDPRIVSTDPADNPREVLALPEGHLGLGCTVAGNTLFYAMLPNYSQRSGLLARMVNDKLETLVSPSQTFGRLLYSRGKLYAASSDFVGLGLQRGPTPIPMRVVELDPITLAEKRAVTIPLERYRNSTGLVDTGDGRLVLGTEGGGIYVIDPTGPEMTARRSGKSCVGTSSIAALQNGASLMICSDQLLVYSVRSGGLAKVADLPPGSSFLVAGPAGDAFTTAQSDIWRTPASLVAAAASQADRTIGDGTAISSQGAPLYVTSNIETLGQSAWIASASVADSYNGGAWAGFDFGEGKSFAAAEVFINWVAPFNTPKEIAIEGSPDGRTWTRIGVRTTKEPPSSAPYWSESLSFNPGRLPFRFWRITPTDGLRDSLAIEFIEFRLRPLNRNVLERPELNVPTPASQPAPPKAPAVSAQTPPSSLAAPPPAPSAVARGVTSLTSQGLAGYATSNISNLGQTAWLSAASVAASYNGGAWAGYDFGPGNSLAAAEVKINWVSPFNTPKSFAIEGSNDGSSWTRVGVRASAAPPSDAPYWLQTAAFNPRRLAFRFWRVTPTEGLRDSLAIEFLDFKTRELRRATPEADETPSPAPTPAVSAPPAAPAPAPAPAAVAPTAAVPPLAPTASAPKSDFPNAVIIGSSELGIYRMVNALDSAQTAWSAAEAVASSYRGGAWLGYEFADVVGVAPKNVQIKWVAPFNTPVRFAIEASDDGRSWSTVTEAASAQPNEAGIYWTQSLGINPRGLKRKFWRITPVSGLRDSFAIEFLQFRR